MKKIFFSSLLLCVCFCAVLAQSDNTRERFIHRGLFRAMGTLSSGVMFKENVTNIYLHGNIEYYVSDNVSLRGDGFWYVNSLEDFPPFEYNHSVLSGASYHFRTKSHFDPYLGLAPGVSIAKRMLVSNNIFCDPGPCPGYENIRQGIDPLISSTVGFNFYFQRWFHLFMEARYIYGRHLVDFSPLSLSELRFSFGLGWNINFIKKKE